MQNGADEAANPTISKQEARATYLEMTKSVREAASKFFMELHELGQFADENLDRYIPDTEAKILAGCSKICDGVDAIEDGLDMMDAVILDYTTPLVS
ncbi:hypothetical protein [Agrobacterium radiobacter]|uniref:hypothetical protein n=1 Tax=Agrobacterium radiobacter TaxID=362 RepID=UPI003CE5885C